jgi:translin
MRGISEIIASIDERMLRLEGLREKSMAASRSVIRMTKRAMHAMHSREDFKSIVDKAASEYGSLYESIRDEPEILHSGPVADAMMELAEACIMSAILTDEDVPSHTRLSVTPQAWAMGLADALGELRRMLLTYLMNGETERAKDMFADMETVCDAVLSFDAPDAILPIRRKQDIARSVMERTRTDIANALIMRNGRVQ